MRRSPASRLQRFLRDVVFETPFVKMLILLVVCWILFSTAMYAAERSAEETNIHTALDALYWGIAAFSTAGIADTPRSDAGKIIGGIWIIFGSAIFFGSIVATITIYFMRPLQRPVRRIVDTIEFNLERLDELSVAELDLLKETTNTLIEHMEGLKTLRQQQEADADS